MMVIGYNYTVTYNIADKVSHFVKYSVSSLKKDL